MASSWVCLFCLTTVTELMAFVHRSMYLFTAAYGVSYGPVAWILPSEVFPLSIRSKGAAISTASNWLNNCECPSSFEDRFANRQLIVFIGLITPAFMSVSVVCVSSRNNNSGVSSYLLPQRNLPNIRNRMLRR